MLRTILGIRGRIVPKKKESDKQRTMKEIDALKEANKQDLASRWIPYNKDFMESKIVAKDISKPKEPSMLEKIVSPGTTWMKKKKK